VSTSKFFGPICAFPYIIGTTPDIIGTPGRRGVVAATQLCRGDETSV